MKDLKMTKKHKNYHYTTLKGGTMKATTTIFSAVLVTLTLVFGFNAFCEEAHPNQTAYAYEHLLDQYIARCDSKIEMKSSSLDNIRKAAAVAMLKGTFAKTYRKELISGMVQEEVDPKSYKVQVYLNDQFYSLVRSKNVPLEKL